MNMKTSDLDAIFNGANVALDTARTAANVFVDGYNGIKGIMNSSRRNFQPGCYGSMNGGYNYCMSQPVQYGYGYAENNCYPQYSMYPSMGNFGNFGYPGNGNGFVNTGYFGFTDPTYGAGQPSGGMTLNMTPVDGNSYMGNSGPQGGAWGL